MDEARLIRMEWPNMINNIAQITVSGDEYLVIDCNNSQYNGHKFALKNCLAKITSINLYELERIIYGITE